VLRELDGESSVKEAPETSVAELVDRLLDEATAAGSTAIHIEPSDEGLLVRMRIDGLLQKLTWAPPVLRRAIINRLKLMASLFSDDYSIQNNRIKFRTKEAGDIDFMLTIAPSIQGEKVVLRRMPETDSLTSLECLGFKPSDLVLVRKAIGRAVGMTLITGPKGSDKISTLCAAVTEIARPEMNISTVDVPRLLGREDLADINICHSDDYLGMTQANICRSLMVGQDSDVIAVGSIEDFDTVDILAQAALSGRMVLAAYCAPDATAAVERLLQMGVDSYLIAHSLSLVVGQRRTRRLCVNCRRRIEPPKQALLDLGVDGEQLDDFPVYETTGCPECRHTGFKGLTSTYEILPITHEIKDLIVGRATREELRSASIRLGMRTFRASGLEMLRHGITNMDEVGKHLPL
jgi:type IV pilus assembly protein PilB